MQYAILCTLLCTALRCPCAAKTDVTQRMTLRGFAAKTDAYILPVGPAWKGGRVLNGTFAAPSGATGETDLCGKWSHAPPLKF